jgi:hypothetical protein
MFDIICLAILAITILVMTARVVIVEQCIGRAREEVAGGVLSWDDYNRLFNPVKMVFSFRKWSYRGFRGGV